MRASLLSLACLAGCVATPQQIVQRSVPHEFYRAEQPKRLADCTAFNARSVAGKYTVFVNELIRPRRYEVVVAEPLRQYTPIIVARTAPAVEGSQLLLYFSDELSPQLTADWTERLMQGC